MFDESARFELGDLRATVVLIVAVALAYYVWGQIKRPIRQLDPDPENMENGSILKDSDMEKGLATYAMDLGIFVCEKPMIGTPGMTKNKIATAYYASSPSLRTEGKERQRGGNEERKREQVYGRENARLRRYRRGKLSMPKYVPGWPSALQDERAKFRAIFLFIPECVSDILYGYWKFPLFNGDDFDPLLGYFQEVRALGNENNLVFQRQLETSKSEEISKTECGYSGDHSPHQYASSLFVQSSPYFPGVADPIAPSFAPELDGMLGMRGFKIEPMGIKTHNWTLPKVEKTLDSYVFIEHIADGSNGSVVLKARLSNCNDNKFYAIKRQRIPKKNNPSEEFRIMSLFHHSQICPLLGRYESQKTDHGYTEFYEFLVMPYFPQTLHQRIQDAKKSGTLAFQFILRWSFQLANGIFVIHQKGYIHRDIKPPNLLLDAEDNLAISDFGISGKSPRKTFVGTPCYYAPEVWNNPSYTQQADMWSVGCVLFELCSLERLDAVGEPAILQKIKTIRCEFFEKILINLLKEDPAQRFTALELLSALRDWEKFNENKDFLPQTPGGSGVSSNRDFGT